MRDKVSLRPPRTETITHKATTPHEGRRPSHRSDSWHRSAVRARSNSHRCHRRPDLEHQLTAGRLGYAASPWADRAYWLGQSIILLPTAIRLLGRRSERLNDTVALVILITVAEYSLKICYSPVAFSFPDELYHSRSTINLLHSGTRVSVNDALPISPYYPGLEEVTSAISSITGLSIFTSGLIAVGVAHLLFVYLLYLLLEAVTSSHRIAGIALLVYSSSPDLSSFDSMFIYQTLALAFLALAVLASWHAAAQGARGQRGKWLTLALLSSAEL